MKYRKKKNMATLSVTVCAHVSICLIILEFGTFGSTGSHRIQSSISSLGRDHNFADMRGVWNTLRGKKDFEWTRMPDAG